MDEIQALLDKVYKAESAKILAVLIRLLGPPNISLAEDVLQDSFSKALQHWQKTGAPKKPTAWLIQAAKNHAIDVIRSHKTKVKFSGELAIFLESEWSLTNTVEMEFQVDRIKDDQLRMIFMCCHESIKTENKVPFILKTLCGFSIAAIARALVLPEATVKKRLFRTRKQFQKLPLEQPSNENLPKALDTVHTVLYLLFNEGFHSSHPDRSIHVIFCQEAIGLMSLLIDEADILNQETLSLFALMHFHISRLESRLDMQGLAIPIDMQDRSLWRQEYIRTANYFLGLAKKVSNNTQSRFLAEALVASEHCQVECFEQTNWNNIVSHYQMLIDVTNSPVAELNQAIAAAYAGELEKSVQQVLKLKNHPSLRVSHMPNAVLAHLYAKLGDVKQAYAYAEKSKKIGGTPNEHRMMMDQLERLLA